MATQLQLYNHACLMMKERRLASLDEDREARRVLDEFYTEVVQFCLEQGMWKFAMRSASLTQTGAGSYGFTYAFSKPTDFVHLFMASTSSDFDPPMVYDYADEGSVFHADASPLYIRYSSNGTSYGNDLTKWPQGFSQYVATELASWAAYPITGNEKITLMLDQRSKLLLANALAMYSLVNEPGILPFNTGARSPIASDVNNLHPEAQPFGAEIKAMLAGNKQGQ
jgi:hypothetical protein